MFIPKPLCCYRDHETWKGKTEVTDFRESKLEVEKTFSYPKELGPVAHRLLMS